MKKMIFICALSILALGCSSSDDEGVTPDNGNDNEALLAAEDYYKNTLKSVITNNCVSCHTSYHSANNSSNYGSFSNAKNNASGMFSQVNSGNMPKDAAKLSQIEIDKFKEFLDLVNAIN